MPYKNALYKYIAITFPMDMIQKKISSTYWIFLGWTLKQKSKKRDIVAHITCVTFKVSSVMHKLHTNNGGIKSRAI